MNCRRTVNTLYGSLALILLLSVASGLASAAADQSSSRYGGKYSVALSSEPESLDPAFITGIYAVTVANNIYDGLVEFDKDLNIVPAIARMWKISRDHRTYSFDLRRGVKFHNGREVTAEDFAYSIRRILDPDTHSPVAWLFLNIRGAKSFHEGRADEVSGLEVLGHYKLKITLDQPFSPFLSILAMVNARVVPKEAVGPEFSKYPVGTGPFQFDRWRAGQEIILTANQHYYQGRSYLDTLYFQIYPNIEWEKVFSNFERGYLDHSIIPSNKYDEIQSSPAYQARYQLINEPTLSLVYVGINCRQKPLDDPRVRRALTMAVDTDEMVKSITKRGSIPARGILPPGIAGFDPNLKGYGYNPVQARELLAQAGYPGGEGIPPLDIWTVSKSESVKAELAAYRKYMAAIGIELKPRVAKNWKHFIQMINDKKAPLYYAAWYADYPDPDNFLFVLCHSASGTNRMGYENSTIDRMLENARQEVDYIKRIQTYRDVQSQVMHDAPLIPQHVNSFNYLFQPWVKGIEVSYLGAAYIPFRKIWIDYLATSQAKR
jgi:peptide/nickel transport system substrate-binding protein/oligopeptide transport system substrate-binding protein